MISIPVLTSLLNLRMIEEGANWGFSEAEIEELINRAKKP